MMKVQFQGHAVVTIETEDQTKLIIDPFISGNDQCPLSVEDLQVDVILLTHAHSDHYGDVEDLAKANDALVIANVELADYLAGKGIKTMGMQPGGQHVYDFGRVKFFPAIHGSSLEINGLPHTLGLACGILIEADGKTLYHVGDTTLYSDMQLIGEREDIDLAFVPIGDHFTMGPEDARTAATWLGAKRVVPIHYNTFPVIEQDPQAFVDSLEAGVGLVPPLNSDIDF